MTIFVNLTPHALNIRNSEGGMVTVPPSGHVARISMKKIKIGELRGISIYSPEMGKLEGLGGLEVGEENVLITSLAAKEAVKAVFPESLVVSPGALIRGEDGQPVGCDGLDA
jgi:hypothetical protein